MKKYLLCFALLFCFATLTICGKSTFEGSGAYTGLENIFKDKGENFLKTMYAINRSIYENTDVGVHLSIDSANKNDIAYANFEEYVAYTLENLKLYMSKPEANILVIIHSEPFQKTYIDYISTSDDKKSILDKESEEVVLKYFDDYSISAEDRIMNGISALCAKVNEDKNYEKTEIVQKVIAHYRTIADVRDETAHRNTVIYCILFAFCIVAVGLAYKKIKSNKPNR